MAEGSRTSRRLPLQAREKDFVQDGVIFIVDHHLVPILAEVLDQIALTRVAIKGQNHELFEKFIFQYVLKKKKLDATGLMALSLP